MPDTSKSHSEKVADEFGHWAQIGKDQAMEKGHGHFTDEALSTWNLNSDHHVLDMGCGNGWALRRMIQRGAGSGVGVVEKGLDFGRGWRKAGQVEGDPAEEGAAIGFRREGEPLPGKSCADEVVDRVRGVSFRKPGA